MDLLRAQVAAPAWLGVTKSATLEASLEMYPFKALPNNAAAWFIAIHCSGILTPSIGNFHDHFLISYSLGLLATSPKSHLHELLASNEISSLSSSRDTRIALAGSG